MLKRYDLFQVHNCGEERRGEMRPTPDGEWVAFEDYLADHALHKRLFEECQIARDEAGFLGPVPECIRDLSERGNKLRETLKLVRESVLELLPANSVGDDLKAKIIARIDADTEYRL